MGVEVTDETWKILRRRATEVMRKAYAPYSNYPVGVAALVEDGRIVTGCNVENASFGLTLCAECGMISELIKTGGGKLVAFTCVNALEEILIPCGRCRQLLYEHGGAELLLMMPGGITPMREVLPEAFGPAHLEETAKEHTTTLEK